MQNSKKKKFLIVFGTRPEALKLIPLYLSLKKTYNVDIISTFQHDSLIEGIIGFYNIPIKKIVFKKSNDMIMLTINILNLFQKLIPKKKYDFLICQGDTISAFLCSYYCFLNSIKLIYLESGLRTNDIYSPWPEEYFRQVISKSSYYNFSPTKTSFDNLINEGISKNKISIIGNTIVDMLVLIKKQYLSKESIIKKLNIKYNFILKNKFILITCHRRENHGEPFKRICKALNRLSIIYPNYKLVFIVHPNPSIANNYKKFINNKILCISPIEYLDFLFLLERSLFIISDSGGIQEEAPYFKKYVIVIREKTERIEPINKTSFVAGSSVIKILSNVKIILDLIQSDKYPKYYKFYGNGNSSSKIIKSISKLL